MIYISNKKLYTSVAAFLYFLLRLINCFLPTSIYFIALFTLVEALPLLLIHISKAGVKPVYFILGTLTLFSVAISMINKVESYSSEIIFTVLGLCLGFHLAKYGIDRKWAYALFYVVTVILLFRIIAAGSVNSVFAVSSRNNISAFSILTAVLVYSGYDRKEHLPLLPAIAAFLLSCVGEGRGGVISSTVLLLGIVIINVSNRNGFHLKKALISLALVAALGFVAVKFYDEILGKAVIRLFSQDLAINERVGIVKQYIGLMLDDPVLFIFGVSREAIPSVKYLNGNFHNSILSLHSTFGIVGFITVTYYILKAICKNAQKKNKVLLLLIIVVCSRIFTDALCFVGFYDPLFYYLLFMSLKRRLTESETANDKGKIRLSEDAA